MECVLKNARSTASGLLRISHASNMLLRPSLGYQRSGSAAFKGNYHYGGAGGRGRGVRG